MKNRTVSELIKWLEQFPGDARVHAYEGEIVGIIVTDIKVTPHKPLGEFET